MKLSTLVPAAAVLGLVVGGPAVVLAQSQGESVEGSITHVELRDTPRHIKVRWSGGEVQQTIANRTRVVFDVESGAFPESELSDLKPGMQVKFNYSEGVLDRLHVVGVPARLLPQRSSGREDRSDGAVPREASRRREMKVRLLSVDARRGEFRAGFQGRRESFRAENPRLLNRFEAEDMVIIVVETRGGDEVVTDIRSASRSGRVVRVDKRRREIVMDVGGREEVYRVDDRDLLEDVDEGDKVRFEFEERSGGRSVITGIQ
jgi:Cu/Ag efflux protein CusF